MGVKMAKKNYTAEQIIVILRKIEIIFTLSARKNIFYGDFYEECFKRGVLGMSGA